MNGNINFSNKKFFHFIDILKTFDILYSKNMEEKMEQTDIEIYKIAKGMYRLDKLLKQVFDEKGTFNEEEYKKTLAEERDRMIKYTNEQLKSKPEVLKEYIGRINECYEAIKDFDTIREYEARIKQEKYEKFKTVNSENLVKSASIIEKAGYKPVKQDMTEKEIEGKYSFRFKVAPDGEPMKTVKMCKLGALSFTTAFNVSSKINRYLVEKNINGTDRRFYIYSNTPFEKLVLAMQKKENGEKISNEEEIDLIKLQEQLSDRFLIAYQTKLGGYVGNIYKGNIDFEPDEYKACEMYSKAKEQNQER